MINGLPDDLVEVAGRHFIEMEPLEQIGTAMGTETGQVRTLTRRARSEIIRRVRGTSRTQWEDDEPRKPPKRATRLPARQRQVLELSEQGLRPSQIAEKLGISANAARVNLCYARKRLTSSDF